MSIRTSRRAALSEKERLSLQGKLVAYYSSSPESYYVQADLAADQYTPALQPFHCDLIQRIRPESSVLELGCGSAHLCRYVESAGGRYTGVDHGKRLLDQNRKRFPSARFFPLQTKLSEAFDLVASLYTIEHVVDPEPYLQQLWDYCRPAGLIAIICPDFVDGEGLPPSFYYGRTSRRFRAKLAAFAVGDAFQHLLDLLWFAPRWKRRARASPPGAFWINLAPRIFAGAEYTVDADAVHLPRLTDIIWWMQERGAEIIDTSLTLASATESVLKHNCYILARKPGIATSAGS